MNIFRLLGDFSHLFSFIFLIRQIHSKKSAEGISLRSQELYALVFLCRYLDFFEFYSVYNTIFKFIYIVTSCAVVYLLHFKDPWKSSYESTTKTEDPFRSVVLIGPCLLLAFVWNYAWSMSTWWGYLKEVCHLRHGPLTRLQGTAAPFCISS